MTRRRHDRVIAALLIALTFTLTNEAFASIGRPFPTPGAWRVRVTGGIPVTLTIHGGGADLNVFIYNPNGSVVDDVDIDYSGTAMWIPAFTGVAVIRVVNPVGDYRITVVGGELLNGTSRWAPPGY
jgi:hypothetical protein